MSLLPRIDRFLRRSAMPPTLFGRLAVKDPRLVGDLRNGRQMRPGTAERVSEFLRRHGC